MRPFFVVGVLLSFGCSGGEITDQSRRDADVDSPGDASLDGSGDAAVCSPPCTADQRCVDGRCLSLVDCCAEITCNNEGELCRECECVSGGADDDNDGFTAASDCDDSDPSIVPGSTRPCQSDCGAEGLELCQGGLWVDCSAPSQCDCDPGDAEQVDCGMCGLALRTCGDDGTWNPQGECQGQGECAPDTPQSQPCGFCGQQSRTCTAECTWGPYGDCLNQGCEPRSTDSEECGICGQQTRVCSTTCTWGGWSGCSGEGVCGLGDSESRFCGGCGRQSRFCDADCQWLPWGAMCSQVRLSTTPWETVNAPGNRTGMCQSSFALSVRTRENNGDGRLDDLAMDCCDQITPIPMTVCLPTGWTNISWAGSQLAMCGDDMAVAGYETTENNSDGIVDSWRLTCCAPDGEMGLCSYGSWVVVDAGTHTIQCPAGSVLVGVESSEDDEDWLVDRLRPYCCSIQ